VTEGQSNQEARTITGQRFAEPLFVEGGVSGEPERYLGEKPYELSKYEFSILKKGKFKSDLWFQLVIGATVTLMLVVLGKTLSALAQEQKPSLENWELWSIAAGIALALSLWFKNKKKPPDDKEFQEITEHIDQHFRETPKRRIHVTSRKEGQE